eukprot:CAMPEP_0117428876 /NCGR_PEP_ID=MMETSP0758-20121206/8488_1 /TAXON_ID=63605 /ORGANISM="Percolomonas cosmopolitus, Strain AE-1 (ATCC 50343)" /LENGTH=167 /DNA_ID=CAMNT_0005215479 /DNA_START=26 /DNA_END=525 /DNA_ORIENTATION=+
MGQSTSFLRPEEIEEMQRGTNFSAKEIKRLYRRFKKLDKDGNGTITQDEFYRIPELAVNPLVTRVVSIFNSDGDVNFKEFVSALSVFNTHGDKHEKLEFAFKIYDQDGDGFISKIELFNVLKMMVGDNLSDIQLQQIVDKTIEDADVDNTGKISFSEFAKSLSHHDV